MAVNRGRLAFDELCIECAVSAWCKNRPIGGVHEMSPSLFPLDRGASFGMSD